MDRATDPQWDSEQDPPVPRADLSVFPLDDDLVVYDPKSGQSFVLNQTGSTIWSLCDGERSHLKIAEELSAHFSISFEQALADVRDLLDELQDADLLVQK